MDSYWKCITLTAAVNVEGDRTGWQLKRRYKYELQREDDADEDVIEKLWQEDLNKSAWVVVLIIRQNVTNEVAQTWRLSSWCGSSSDIKERKQIFSMDHIPRLHWKKN